jgi:hypothetical protein
MQVTENNHRCDLRDDADHRSATAFVRPRCREAGPDSDGRSSARSYRGFSASDEISWCACRRATTARPSAATR